MSDISFMMASVMLYVDDTQFHS